METQVKALTTLRSALRAFFGCGNSAFSQQISTFYGPSVQTMETRLGARQRRRPPSVHRGSTHARRLQRPVATEDEASAYSELRLGCHPETPVIEPCQNHGNHGMVQILGYSGNSTDRPHASTVGIRSVVGPIAGSGMLEAVPAQPVEPVQVRLASQELSGEFSHSLQALAPLQRPVMEAECGPDQGS